MLSLGFHFARLDGTAVHKIPVPEFAPLDVFEALFVHESALAAQ